MNKELLENIKKTIVFIGYMQNQLMDDGKNKAKIKLSGTGFIFQLNKVFFLATAKHVIAEVDPKTGKVMKEKPGLFVFNNMKNGSVRFSSIDELKKSYKFFYHTNDKVDITIIPFPLNITDDDVKVFAEDMFVDGGNLYETYDVFFASYQPGISDLAIDSKIIPIVRKGSIARMNSNKSLYIDGSAFPGNSGSPVFVMPSPIRYSSNNNSISFGDDTIGGKFIGIISQYTPYTEVAISQQTGRPRVIFEENTGLSLVWLNDYLKEIMQTKEFSDFILSQTSKK